MAVRSGAFYAVLIASMVGLLAGCGMRMGTTGADYSAPASGAATAWQSQHVAVAHGGSAEQLADWWARLKDPALDALLAAAQRESATLARAAAVIEQARAEAVAAGVAGLPTLDGVASVNRAALSFGGPAVLRTQSQWGVQSSWEIDLFGRLARQRESAAARVAAGVANWHEARVSLAAEVATAYANYRFCEIQAAHANEEARSLATSARLADVSGQAGFQSGAEVALAKASAAESSAAALQRRAQCEVALKGLVALTAMTEQSLRALLAGSAAQLPQPTPFRVAAIPARALAQRPDLAAAERRIAAASADIGIAEADKYPRLTLAGSITPTRMQLGTSPAISFDAWSIGPSLVLPLVDGGRRDANVAAARAQYAAAEVEYRALARRAVREVEEALVSLSAVDARETEATRAALAMRTQLDAVQSRLRAGLAGGAEVEVARRQSMSAEFALATLSLERLAAWVSLYRAAGGGWDGDTVNANFRVDAK